MSTYPTGYTEPNVDTWSGNGRRNRLWMYVQKQKLEDKTIEQNVMNNTVSLGSTSISGTNLSMAESQKMSRAGGQATGRKTILPFLSCHDVYTLLWEEPEHFYGTSASLTQFC